MTFYEFASAVIQWIDCREEKVCQKKQMYLGFVFGMSMTHFLPALSQRSFPFHIPNQMNVPSGSRIPAARLAAVSLLVGMTGSFHFGIQLTATNPSHLSFLQFANDAVRTHYGVRLSSARLEALWSVVISLLFVGAIAGSLLIRPMADHFGRLRSLLYGNMASTVCLLGCALAHFRKSVELFALARLGLGFSLAFCLGMAGVFLPECSPKLCRGSVSMATGVLLQLGTIFGSVLGIPTVLGSLHRWWLLFVLEASQLLCTNVLLACLAHESPGFLLSRGQEGKARRSLAIYHKCDLDSRHLEKRMAELSRELAEQAAANVGGIGQQQLGCVVALSMAFSGIAVINAFAVELFRATGLSQAWATLANVGLSVLSLLANVASAFVIDRCGRRSLLLTMLGTILAANVAISGLMIAYEQTQHKVFGLCLIGVIAIFVIAFAIGPGPICYFLPAEMVEQNARSAAQGLATLGQMTSRAILLSLFLPLKNGIGEGFAYFSLFFLPILLALIFLFRRLPETKNRSAAEVHRQMHKMRQIRLRRKQSLEEEEKRRWHIIIVNDDRGKAGMNERW